MTGYFNDTPVRVLCRDTLGGEACVLVEWPNGNRSWLAEAEVRDEPKGAA